MRGSGLSGAVLRAELPVVAEQRTRTPRQREDPVPASLGMPLGNLLEAKILIEVGGGTGSADFPVANVTATNP
jgi:hypothetical protein